MDTIGQFYTKRNSTNYTPIKKAEYNESNAYKKETVSDISDTIKKRKLDESDTYKKDTDWTILDIDWTPIEVDWKSIDDTWTDINTEWKR